MNPLDARTPGALFGTAASDPVQLKRAYARLVRQYGPESDPTAFEHIRRLYEEATTALREPARAEEASPAAAPDSMAEIERLLALATEETLDRTADQLLALAIASDDHEALTAALAIDRCRDLDRLPDRLLAAAENPALFPRIVAHARHILGMAGALVTHPAWAPLSARLVEPPARLALLIARARIFCQRGRREEAWALFLEQEAWARSLDPEAWWPVALELLDRCAWVLSDPALDEWADRLCGTVPEALEVTCARAEALLRGVRAARAEREGDGGALRDLPERLHDEHQAVALVLLQEALAAPGAREELARRLEERPAWTYVFWLQVQRLTGEDGALWRWQAGGGPPMALVPGVEQRLRVTRDVDAAKEELAALERTIKRGRSRFVLGLSAMLCLFIVGISLSLGRDLAAELVIGLGLVLYLGSLVGYEHVVIQPRLARAAELRARPLDLSPILALCQALALWPHELAAQAPEDTAFDSLLCDLPASLGVAGDEHIRRSIHTGESI